MNNQRDELTLDLQHYYDEFLDYMRAEKNASNATITSYTTDFRVFNDYFTSKGPVQV